MTTKKTAAAPSSARDTADAVLNAMSETSNQNAGISTNSTVTTEFDEAYGKASSGPASAKLKK